MGSFLTKGLLLGLSLAVLSACSDPDAPATPSSADTPGGLALTAVKTPQTPSVKEGQVLVEQFLWLRCIHCFHAEPLVEAWDLNERPDNVVFRRVPVVWGPDHARDAAYIALANLLQDNRAITPRQYNQILQGLFDIVFRQQAPLVPDVAFPVFAPFGLFGNADELAAELASMPVVSRVAEAERLTQAYGVRSVPNFVVEGRHFFHFSDLGEDADPGQLFTLLSRFAEGRAQP